MDQPIKAPARSACGNHYQLREIGNLPHRRMLRRQKNCLAHRPTTTDARVWLLRPCGKHNCGRCTCDLWSGMSTRGLA